MERFTNLHLKRGDAKILVIDVQNDVCHSDSDYAKSTDSSGVKRDVRPIQDIVENGIIPFLETARRNRLPIGFVQSIYRPGQYPDVSPKWLTIDDDLDDAEWRIKIYRDMPEQGESVFRKDTQNPFIYKEGENGLGDWLRGVPYVLVAGFVSYGCIKTGVDALLERHYIPVVLEDCIEASAYRKDEHNRVLASYKIHEIIHVVGSGNISIS